jgi:hypothetical protein
MWKIGSLTKSRWALPAMAVLGLAVGVGLTWPLASAAQDKTDKTDKTDKPDPHAVHKAADADKDLAAQVAELKDRVAKLEAALDKSHPGTSGMGGMQGKGMGGMMGMDGMMGGMMGKGMGGMQGMGMDGMMGMGGMQGMGGAQGMQGMNMMDMDMMGMMGMMGKGSMGGMSGMGKMQMASALPGFPGASHIYHIGSAGFFLDHADHITLTTEQQTRLNQVKQKALLDKEAAQRKIDDAEQELWQLTASDTPDAAAIQEKIQAIEKLRGDQRLAFIRSVGEAAKVLTDEQRKVLLGTMPPQKDTADPHAGHKHPPDNKDKP